MTSLSDVARAMQDNLDRQRVICVTLNGEEERPLSHFERQTDGSIHAVRRVPVLREGERAVWVLGDDRPHIFKDFV